MRRGVAFGAAALSKFNMTYHALARKWRPRTFDQLVGQEAVVNILSNSLNKNRIHHACLFTGTRGVGKTSVARLFAKAMNCERAISAEPCLQCASCISIEQGCCIDLVEIDAASHTGVDHMRELLDNVQYAPTSARFKVYLIDEIHMLSNQSFNALLKTLEEPPNHIKFLLATTDPQKLPKTVLSRCLQFHLRHITPEVISNHLEYILQEESITFEKEALEILAHAAAGSMRDALSLLDQAIAGSQGNICIAEVKQILGYTQQDYALQLLQTVCNHQPETLHALVQAIANEGSHFLHVLEETLHYLHKIAVYQTLSENPSKTSETIKTIAEQLRPEEVQLFYQIALKGSEEIQLAPTLKIGFHMIFLRMLAFKPAPALPFPGFNSNKPSIESVTIDAISPVSNPVKAPDRNKDKKRAPEITRKPVSVPTNGFNPASKTTVWSEIIQSLSLQGLTLTALQQTELLEKNKNECILKVTQGHYSLFTPTVRTKVQQALSTWYEEKIVLTFKIEEVVQASPAQQQAQIAQHNQIEARDQLLLDPVFQQIQQNFSAELIENSIEYAKNDI